MSDFAWPLAFAFAAMCAAIAFTHTYGPPYEDSERIVCIKARGNWKVDPKGLD